MSIMAACLPTTDIIRKESGSFNAACYYSESVMNEFATRAELSGFQETSRYNETIDYCLKAVKASQLIRYSTFGVSPEGRDLPLLIVSKDGISSPQEAQGSGRTIVLVLNGIHPGEIAGKEASFALVRDIAVTRAKADLLDRLILLVIPIYNVDGHERVSPYNRINQNGPKEMGWRTNSRNRNLNRDWMKAEEVETKALLQLYNDWLPHFVIDNHVSDGADFQYDVTYLLDDNIRVARPVFAYLKERLEPGLNSGMIDLGHIIAPYFELRNQTDPADGLMDGPITARFSNGFGALRNRPNITVETHMLKDFRTRIVAHYDFMEVIFRMFHTEGQVLQSAIAQADMETAQIKGDYPIRLALNEQESHQFLYKGVDYKHEKSEASGSTRVIYGKSPIELNLTFFKAHRAERTIQVPLGYLIPPQYADIIECLRTHRIAFQLIKRDIAGDFSTYRFQNVSWQREPFEGHHMVNFDAIETRMRRTFPKNSAVVWLDQTRNKIIMELLEPDSADSFVSWGFFNAIFEDKEYAEAFILEELAENMLKSDHNIATDFESLLNQSEKFRNDPAARLRFFYDRSPYRDERKNVYPIARLIEKSQIPADAL
jgi:Zinc carboxypeptidase